eukprot:TRINITY_DN1467_c0_g2_i1.p1 TRINITY_DN1467_c0_g2~~TRINITY_DN1467_c0_g2_i1.p1  ORF type:complete len:912 (-),score=304.57 TRINITY_DN1467_c0_g2_i1:798-3449(-)
MIEATEEGMNNMTEHPPPLDNPPAGKAADDGEEKSGEDGKPKERRSWLGSMLNQGWMGQEHYKDRPADELALNSKMMQLRAKVNMNNSVKDAKQFSKEEHQSAAEAAKSLLKSITEEEVAGATHMTGPYSHMRRAFESDIRGNVAHARVFLRPAKGISPYVFDPGSRLHLTWTIVVLLVTLMICFAIPVNLAWQSGNDTKTLFMGDSAVIIAMNITAYIIFWTDMTVQFNLAVWLSDGSFVTTRREIARHYLVTWFFWDFMASMPWEYMFFEFESELLKLTTLLRFGRLFQSFSLKHLLQQYERTRQVNYEAIQLARFAVMLPLVLHVMGCGLFIVANIAGEGYDFRQANDIGQDSDFLQWVYGIYWAAMTVSTIGYGDVDLVTFAERGYAIACMLVGASLYAYLVGALINIMQIMASAERERRDKLTRVNQLMSDVHLPRMQQVKVRHFMGDVHVLRDVQLPEHQQEMSLLSPPFAAALARHLFRAWLPHVWWLRTTDDSFITRMALLVKAQSFAPRDAIFRAGNSASAVYVLSSGVLLRYTLKGALHLEQCEDGYGESCFMFGQESLLAAASVYSYSAYAASYVSLWRIDRSPFMALLNEFPSMRARVRWGSAMLLLRRARAVTGHGPPQVSHEGAHEGAQLQQGGSQEQVEGPSSQLPCKEGVTQAPATANTGMESPDSSAHQGTSTSGSSSSSDSRRFDRAGSSIAQSGTRGSRGGSAGNEDRGIDSGGIANGGGGSNSGSGGNSDSGGTSGSSGNDGNGGNSGSDGGDGCGIDDNGGRGCGSCTSSASCVIAGLEVADGSSIISPRYSGRGTWRASHLQHMGCGDTSGGSSSGGTGTGAGTNAMSAELDTLAEGLQSALLSIAALRERVAAAETPTLV